LCIYNIAGDKNKPLNQIAKAFFRMRANSYCRYILLFCACTCLAFCGFIGCQNLITEEGKSTESSKEVALYFSLNLNPGIYKQTKYKKPPQFAIWIEDAEGTKIQTIWVTEKTGTGNWGGKITRPVSLPYWVSRWKKETRSSSFPTPENPVVDGVTGATPREHFTSEIKVPINSTWNYYIEINVSGDYNDTFATVLKDERRDQHGNGQPSIIYKGQITAIPGQRSVPQLIGRTDQIESVSHIIPDLEGISMAKNLLSKIEVTSKSFD